MKANFALSLSFDGLRLLHRAAGGWRLVGDVALDNPTLGAALAQLRDAAQALEPDGLRTKLIIPSDQIKYLTIDTPTADETARRIAAEVALNGATPYPVDALAFDISPDGEQTHIAAVARETLQEAEQFAATHHFNPISAVAVPGDAPFLGEPFFGATLHSQSMLDAGDAVTPDYVAVVEITTPDAPALDDALVDSATHPTNYEPEAVSATTQIPDPTPFVSAPKPETESEPTWVPDAPLPGTEFAEPYAPDTVDVDAADAGQPVPGFSSRRSDQSASAFADAPAIKPDEPRMRLDVLAAEVPFDDDLPDPSETSDAAPTGFASRRAPMSATGSGAGLTATDRLFATRAKRPEAAATPFAAHRSEKQQMTIFGARKPDARPTSHSRARGLGLALTALILVALAGVAAWATVFREDGLTRFFAAPRVEDTPATLENFAPEPNTENTTNFGQEDVRTASLDITPPEPVLPVLAVPEPNTAFDPDTAEAHYAVTGIWTIPPDVPQAPSLLGLDDLYITSIDRSNLSFDAVALAPGSAFATDIAFAAPASPAPPGTDFVLDSRGLVIPTAQGALSPEGALVFLGRPIAVPPARPNIVVAQPKPTPNPNAELAAFRPQARPDGLVEQTERQQLGGLSRAELAEIRPQARPATAKQEAEADETPTAQAAANSKRPASRPRNFDRLVARARSAPSPRKPAEAEAPVRAVAATVAPRTVTPRIPSSASAAKQATVRRAINLNRINLMGVYGTPSNRRALVRLANGRYKKVRVGDRIDGGKVSAISEGELRYQKGARNVVLKMPKS